MTTGKKLLCIGHRGAMGHAPENTLASIRKALGLGACAIEVDVYYVDGNLIVFHDEHLARTTDGTGLITDHPFSYLRQLDAGGGQQIPTLNEVCSETAGRALLNIELKGQGTATPVTGLLADLSRVGWEKSRFLVSSFNHDELNEVARLDSEVKLGVLISKKPIALSGFATHPGAFAVCPSLEIVTKELVDDVHSKGLKVYVYTVNKPEDIEQMYQFGVDGVFTNYPERVVGSYDQITPAEGWN